MADRGEAIRLAGTIHEIVRAPGRWRVEVGGTTTVVDEAGELIVDVDGAAVRVDIVEGALCDDGAIAKGGWGELVPGCGGRFAAGLAPAFTPATLEMVTLASGAQVEIYGEVVSRAFADDGGMRDAPSSRVDRVRALLISSGDDRTARIGRAVEARFPPASRLARASWAARRAEARKAIALDPGTRDPGSPRYRPERITIAHALVWAAITIVATVLGVANDDHRFRVLALAAAVGALVYRPGPPVRPFRALDKRYGASLHPTEGWWFASLAIWTFVALTVWASWSARAVGYVALAMIVIVFATGLAGAPTYARHRRLRRAPLWKGELGVHAAFEGVVGDPTPIKIGDANVAIGRGTGFDETIGSDPDRVVWHRFHSDGTFLVKTDAGVVEISPQQIVWSTTVTIRATTDHQSADYEVVEIIPVGGRVLAAGWIEAGEGGGPPKLSARGTEPALLVATGPAGEPRYWLAQLARTRVISALGLLGIGVVLGWELWLR
jgi:hypothetical protein